MSGPIVPPTAWEMTREVYSNRDFLLEELAAWVFLLVGVLMGFLAETPLIGISLMVGACLLTYHSHRRAFRHLVDQQAAEDAGPAPHSRS